MGNDVEIGKEDGDEMWGDGDYEASKAFQSWNTTTLLLGDLAALPLSLIQLPQFIVNSHNLLFANYEPLFAISWKVAANSDHLTLKNQQIEMATSIGNLAMLSYFTHKNERGGVLVQTCCLIMSLLLQIQLAIAGAMPLWAIKMIIAVSMLGMYQQSLPNSIRLLFDDLIAILSSAAFAQTTVTFLTLHTTYAPGLLCAGISLLLVITERIWKMPLRFSNVRKSTHAWNGMLLCMWTSIWQIVRGNTGDGISILMLMLAMIGNALQLPRAMFTRDLLWYTGAILGSLFEGWGILLRMYICAGVSDTFFWLTTWGLGMWLSRSLQSDANAYRLSSSFIPVIEILSATRSFSSECC